MSTNKEVKKELKYNYDNTNSEKITIDGIYDNEIIVKKDSVFYLRLNKGQCVNSINIFQNIVVDISKNGVIVGIEVLN